MLTRTLFSHPEGDDVPLVYAKFKDWSVPHDGDQLPLPAGLQIAFWVPRHLLKCQGWTHPHILGWDIRH